MMFLCVERKSIKMLIEADTMITQSEANRDFGKVCRIVDDNLYAVILRYSEPRYILVSYDEVGDAMDKLGFDLITKQNN